MKRQTGDNRRNREQQDVWERFQLPCWGSKNRVRDCGSYFEVAGVASWKTARRFKEEIVFGSEEYGLEQWELKQRMQDPRQLFGNREQLDEDGRKLAWEIRNWDEYRLEDPQCRDLLRELRTVGIGSPSDQHETPNFVVTRFLRARTNKEILTFLQDYGPVLASPILGLREREDGVVERITHQSKKIFREEQTVLRKLIRLLTTLHELAPVFKELDTAQTNLQAAQKHPTQFRRLRAANAENLTEWEIKQPQMRALTRRVRASFHSLKARTEDTDALAQFRIWKSVRDHNEWFVLREMPYYFRQRIWEGILDVSHRLSTAVLNCFPLQTSFHIMEGSPIFFELPGEDPTGIRPSLYFITRKIFLAGRELRFCRNCLKLCLPTGHRPHHCSSKCAKLQRDRDLKRRIRRPGLPA
jgi:hypothetical protein